MFWVWQIGREESSATPRRRQAFTQLRVLGKGTRTKKELDVREWECLFCNTIHDRDINAAINLNIWAGGQSDQDKNGRGASVSQAKLAVCCEASTTYEQLSLF